jgi:KDO2-lipid IV(A) lauroyltransferase
MLYAGYVMARILCAILPLRLSYWIAERVGDLWYLLSPPRRANLKWNLRHVPAVADSGADIDRICRRAFRNFARVVTEFLYLPRIRSENLGTFVDLESFGRLRDRLGESNAILVTAHIGNWELAAVVCAMLGTELWVVVYDHPEKRIARLFRRRRQAKGLKVMSVREAARAMPLALKQGSVGVVGDRDFSRQGMNTTFFGLEVTLPFAYANLAVSMKVPVITGFCVRHEDGKYHLRLEDVVYSPGRDSITGEQIVTRCVQTFEKCVEKYPEQWYFFDRMGKETEPSAQPNPRLT